MCGFGYLIDLLYAQAFALVAPAMQQELGFSGMQRRIFVKSRELSKLLDAALGNLFSAFGAGLCAGVSIYIAEVAARLNILLEIRIGLCLGGSGRHHWLVL